MFVDTEFELVIDGDVGARDRVRHRFLADGVQRIDIRERGLHGTFFTPAATGRRPAILIVGGSEGALHEGSAALLASHGFATLALAYFGDPLPCIPFSFGWKSLLALLSHRFFRKPMEARASFSEFATDASLLETATIPVEKINGPVLLFSGGDDRMWSSVELAQIVVDRLERSAFAHRCEHVSYPDAGHAVLGVPATPTFATDVTTRFVLGGTPEANARAHVHAWPRVLDFFREHL